MRYKARVFHSDTKQEIASEKLAGQRTLDSVFRLVDDALVFVDKAHKIGIDIFVLVQPDLPGMQDAFMVSKENREGSTKIVLTAANTYEVDEAKAEPINSD